MRLLLQLPLVKLLTFLLLPHILLGQDQGQSGGGESAAESSVTTSSSKKSAAAPETIESNPVVTVVKSGLPIQTAISIPVDEMVQVAEAGGSLTNLKTTATTIVKLKAQGKDPSAVIKSAVKAINKGIKFTSSTGQGFLDVAVSLVDGKIKENELADVKSNLDSGVDLTVQENVGVSTAKRYVDSGMTGSQINTQLKGKSGDELKKAITETENIAKAVASGKSYADAQKAGSLTDFLLKVEKALGTDTTAINKLAGIPDGFIVSNEDKFSDSNLQDSFLAEIDFFKSASANFSKNDFDLLMNFVLAQDSEGNYLHADTDLQSIFSLLTADSRFLELASDLLLIKNTEGNFIYQSNTDLQDALAASFAVFSSTFIKDYTGNDAITSSDKLPVEINYASLTASGGYTPEIIKLLVSYGAIGSKGDQLAEKLGFAEDSTITEFLGTVTDGTTTINQKSATSDFFSLLTTLTGDSDIGDPDGDNDGFLDPSKNSVLNISRDDVSLSPGSKITLGQSGTSSTIDVSTKLPEAKNNNSANKSDPDRKIYVIGASKDMVIAGDVTFTNTNEVEDHALALGSADDLYFRSEYNSANNADYDDPDPINLTYTGSNLGIGSEDTLRLVNVNISTGGNLAIGSLSDLHIGLKDGHESTFSVGTGGENSDPDNVYMYASNLLSINGLQFAGRVDDVYMDAIRIDLKNVTFPGTSEVMARSRDGTINAGAGSVNFYDNVKHGSDLITGAKGLATNEFNGKDGHWDLNKKLENGKSAFVIRKR
jgi:hypothetical protein